MQFDRICRVCLVECDNTKSIFEECLSEKIKDLAGIELDPNDALPKLLCNICVTEIHHWHTFKLKLLQSNTTLRKLQEDRKGTYIRVKKEFTLHSNNDETGHQSLGNGSINSYIKKETSSEEIQQRELKCNTDILIKKESLVIEHNPENALCHETKNETVCESTELFHGNEISETTKPHTCQICSKSFETMNTLLHHQKFHAEIRPHICETCGKSFTLLSSLRQHSKGTHTIGQRPKHKVVKPFSCEYCTSKFQTAKQLQQHRRSHNEAKQYICEVCNKRFQNPDSLRMHKKVHTSTEPFICQFCGRDFRLKIALEDHVRSVHNHLVCSLCSTGFATIHSLNVHMEIFHARQKNRSKHFCQTCNEWFDSLGQLKSHMSNHRVFKCDLCRKIFKSKKAKAAHRKTHSDVKNR